MHPPQRRYEVCQNVSSDRCLVEILLVQKDDHMDHDGRTLSILFEVSTITSVARDTDRTAVQIRTIAVGGLYQWTMVHFKSRYLDAVALIDHPILAELRWGDRHTVRPAVTCRRRSHAA
jgi:hypothetical protein